MVILLDKRKWREQPKGNVKVRRNCAVTDGLIFAYIPGHPVEFALGQRMITNRPVTIGPGGTCTLPSSSVYTEVPAPADASAPTARYDLSALTVLVIAKQTTQTNSGISLCRSNGSSTAHWFIGLHMGTNDGPYAGIGNYTYTPTSGNDALLNDVHAVALSADGANASVYMDGAYVSGGAYTPPSYAYNAANHRTLVVGSNGLANGLNTQNYLSLLWDHVHDAELIRAVSIAPYGEIFERDPRIVYFDLASGGIALTGSSQSASYGLVIPSSAIAQTGQQVSSNSGSIAASIQYLAQLTGLSSSTVAGSIAPALLAALGGQAANFSQGPLSTAISAAISGIDTASAQGTLTALQVIEKALPGQESAFSSGPIAAVLDLALSGSEITASFGTVAASLGVIQALTGLSSTASVGDIIAALNTAVSGIENTLAGGTVTPLTGIIAQLSGLESSLLEGSIATAVTRILSGQAAEIQNGSPIVGRTVSVSGFEISSAANQVGVSAAIGATSASVILQNGTISVYNPDVTLGISGSQIALQYGLLSKEAQLALFGQDLAISGGQLVAIVEALGLGQSINIMQGSASLSVDKSLSGLVTLSGSGTVVFTDNNLQLALNGQSILTSAGRIYIKGGVLGSSSITILQV